MASPRTTEEPSAGLALTQRVPSWLRLAHGLSGLWPRSAILADVLAVFVTIKAGFYLLALFGTWMIPEYAGSTYQKWYSGADRLIDISWRWDSQWYMSIVREGYKTFDATHTNLAFFPLYPLLIKALGFALGEANLALAGVLVANTAFFAALFYLHRLASMDGGRDHARRAIWYVAIYPAAFFFGAAYAESLFLLTAAATLYHLRRGEVWRAGLWGFLGALTRTQGILLLLPIAWEAARLAWRQRRPPWRQAPALALPPLGVALFMAYLYVNVGDPLAFLHVQSVWHRSFALPPAAIWGALQLAVAGYKEPSYPMGLINTASVIVFLVVALASLRRWPAVYSLYAFASLVLALLLPVADQPTVSDARFMAVVFPVLFTLAAWTEKRPTLDRFLTTISLLFYALLTVLFTNWYWVV